MTIIEILNCIKRHWDMTISLCAIFGIAVDVTPYIKFNPIRWALSKIGKLLNSELLMEIDKIKSENKRIEEENDQRRIKDLRFKILDFSNSLKKRERDIEEFDIIYELHDEYGVLLKKYQLENGKVSRAMRCIDLYYNQTQIQDISTD